MSTETKQSQAYGRRLVWLTAVTLVIGAPAWAIADTPTPASFYANSCANCHGTNGKNPRLDAIFPDLPDFTSAKWEATHTKAELSKSILHGKGPMPAFRGDLKGLTVEQMVDYVRHFAWPGKGASGDPRQANSVSAAQFYQAYCARCHGANGQNAQLAVVFPDLPDFSNAKWEATHTKAELSKSILHGKGAMPAFKGDLGGLTADQMVEYIRKFAKEGKAQ